MTNFIHELYDKRNNMIKIQKKYRDDLLWTSSTSRAASNLLVEVARDCLYGIDKGDMKLKLYKSWKEARSRKCIGTQPINQK